MVFRDESCISEHEFGEVRLSLSELIDGLTFAVPVSALESSKLHMMFSVVQFSLRTGSQEILFDDRVRSEIIGLETGGSLISLTCEFGRSSDVIRLAGSAETINESDATRVEHEANKEEIGSRVHRLTASLESVISQPLLGKNNLESLSAGTGTAKSG